MKYQETEYLYDQAGQPPCLHQNQNKEMILFLCLVNEYVISKTRVLCWSRQIIASQHKHDFHVEVCIIRHLRTQNILKFD